MMHNTKYGCSTIPPKKTKQSKVCAVLHSPLTSFTFGILFGFFIGYAMAYVEYGMFFICVTVSDSNFTSMKSDHFELTLGITQFLHLLEEVHVDDSLSPYSEDIISQLSNIVFKKLLLIYKIFRRVQSQRLDGDPLWKHGTQIPHLRKNDVMHHKIFLELTLSPCADII